MSLIRHLQFILLALFTSVNLVCAQIVTLSPTGASADDEVVLVFDAAEGTGDLVGAEKVYIHSGLITDGPDGTEWKHVIGNWGMDDGVGQMTKVSGEDDKWEITFSPTIREYHSAPGSETIFRLAMVFRNADGSEKGAGNPGTIDGGTIAENGDIFMDLSVEAYVQITAPSKNEFLLHENESFTISAEASTVAETLVIYTDEGSGYQELASSSNVETLEETFLPSSSGTINIKAIATISGQDYEDIKEFYIVVSDPSPESPVPDGIISGINYDDADNTKVTLSLLAPGKELVYVVGDFTNWEIDLDYLMKVDPDGERFWLEITGLNPGQEYVFQYWVDGTIRTGDPFCDKVADPWNDQWIPESIYPGLPDYDNTDFGIASVLQTGQTPFPWDASEEIFEAPEKNDLIVYELLIRDFLGSHYYQDLIDTLSYLKTLGVNAIELMPVMEFEGNESWGYNPAYFFAPDKYYGTKNDLKEFIQSAHQEGFAVILDMVLNHAFGSSPMVQMYWDENNARPSSDSPWFNQEATHPFSVGYDFNHESQYTKDFVDSVNVYWLEEYHFDGFRFDLSKGFTQTVNTDVGQWGKYDQSRIDILTRMANNIWESYPEAYVILEHFAEVNEEQALASEGMLLWGNLNHTSKDVLTASNPGSNLSGAKSSTHVTYMESHDEQRQKYYVDIEGNKTGAYDTRNFYTALDRMKMGAVFFLTVPGPKMMWQFQELGYDIDINFNGRVGNKPLPWGSGGLGYYEDTTRQKLYGTIASVLSLRNDYSQVFTSDVFSWQSSGNIKWINIEHDDLNLVVIGNFGVVEDTTTQQFTKTGTWYDYFTSIPLEVTSVDESVNLQPGEFHMYVDREVNFPDQGLVGDFQPIITVDPSSFYQRESITITFDATQADPNGTNGLVGAEKVYMHSGVILDPESSDWSNTVGNLGADDGVGLMTNVEGETDKWEISIIPEDYYGVSDRIFKIAMYFRDATNTNQGTGPAGTNLIIDVEADPESSIVWTEPSPFTASQEVTIFFDASLADPAGTAGLVGVDKVYMHSGTITDSPTGTSWDHVIGNWGQDDGIGLMTTVAGKPNQWQITLTPREYYDVPNGTTIYRLGMVFRNSDGSREGKASGAQDIFVDVDYLTPVESTLTHGREFRIYPNPSKDQVNILFDKARTGSTLLRIYNSFGKLIDERSLPGNVKDFSLSTSALSNGMYLFDLSGDGVTEVVRVLVNK